MDAFAELEKLRKAFGGTGGSHRTPTPVSELKRALPKSILSQPVAPKGSGASSSPSRFQSYIGLAIAAIGIYFAWKYMNRSAGLRLAAQRMQPVYRQPVHAGQHPPPAQINQRPSQGAAPAKRNPAGAGADPNFTPLQAPPN
jgi:hypothetical protein